MKGFGIMNGIGDVARMITASRDAERYFEVKSQGGKAAPVEQPDPED